MAKFGMSYTDVIYGVIRTKSSIECRHLKSFVTVSCVCANYNKLPWAVNAAYA